ncbi:DUF4336 domain-containing protein [Maritimibacter sp. DP1N21-5]|uniref:DUF4336 domain-containing protein n=1 Tax=Maritimibacter sp. DP1N21-5 TaxID=2836867 RepID=UPI001C456488|nr:DUF4336 domain-containing protein [Maritimibacter sp. DP1N21-5]MBV7409730.1 DUF4336 domain-containing protein [Maritimibacter sp. DP1N21-5]
MTPFGSDLWLIDGPHITAALGFHYPTRMAVARLPEGGLWLWSPVRPDPSIFAAIEALGSPRWIVAPNTLHHVHVAAWKAQFPKSRIAAAPGLGAPQKAVDFSIDRTLEADLPEDWGDTFDVVTFDNRLMRELVFFHRPSGTAIFTDMLQNMPPDWYRGWRRVVARLDRMTEPEPTVPRKFRMGFRDKTALRGAVARVQGWPVERVLMAHGTPVAARGGAVIRRAFGWV